MFFLSGFGESGPDGGRVMEGAAGAVGGAAGLTEQSEARDGG